LYRAARGGRHRLAASAPPPAQGARPRWPSRMRRCFLSSDIPAYGIRTHRQTLAPRQGNAWPGPHHRIQCARHAARSAHGLAGGGRGLARGARLHCPRQGQGPGPGGAGQPEAWAGAGRHRECRAGRHHGRRRGRHQPERPATRHHPDGRSAGCGQDHHHRQAGQAPGRKAQEEGADRVGRRVPPRGHRAAQDRDCPGRRRVVPLDPRPEAPRHRRGGLGLRQEALLRRAAGRHGRPPGHRRAVDGRNQGPARHPESGGNPVRGRCHAGPGRDQHRQGLQGSAAADRHRADQAGR